MANKNAPAHDFAPAWLKIPSYDNFRPSGADGEHGGHTSRRDEHRTAFTRCDRDVDPLGCRQQYSDSRRDRDAVSGERKPSYLPSRHHSIDFDDSQHSVGSARLFSPNTPVGPPSNSQPSLLRRPHSRHDFRDITATYGKLGSPSQYGDSGNFYGNKNKEKVSEQPVNSNNCSPEGRGIDVTGNKFNQEFPSLQGDISEEPSTLPPAVNGGVWEKPRSVKVHGTGIGKKIQLVKRVKNDGCSEGRKSPSVSSPSSAIGQGGTLPSSGISNSSNSHSVITAPVAKGGSVSSSIYRALVPAKSTLSKKSGREGLKLSSKKLSSTPPPPSHSMEILVKNPKAPGNKSEFLKALRNENKGEDLDVEEDKDDEEGKLRESCSQDLQGHWKNEGDEDHVNGVDIGKLAVVDDGDQPALSSSLEAEQRLLKEMGWKEEGSDDDAYAPLTEDELREFRDLSQKIAQNGTRRNLQASWSPRRLTPFNTPAVVPPADTWSSSSESDSDF